mmetsp:Transcript_5484/g.12482  ORF Transcript_5484/g.12482 Transcript_5484/m.12482 type:complete len:231 (-) Transcript_5484:1455-2147(-)
MMKSTRPPDTKPIAASIWHCASGSSAVASMMKSTRPPDTVLLTYSSRMLLAPRRTEPSRDTQWYTTFRFPQAIGLRPVCESDVMTETKLPSSRDARLALWCRIARRAASACSRVPRSICPWAIATSETIERALGRSASDAVSSTGAVTKKLRTAMHPASATPGSWLPRASMVPSTQSTSVPCTTNRGTMDVSSPATKRHAMTLHPSSASAPGGPPASPPRIPITPSRSSA